MARKIGPIQERVFKFVEELKRDFPVEEVDGLTRGIVVVGTENMDDGTANTFGATVGNPCTVCHSLTALFDNDEMIELIKIAAKWSIDRKKRTKYEQDEIFKH